VSQLRSISDNLEDPETPQELFTAINEYADKLEALIKKREQKIKLRNIYNTNMTENKCDNICEICNTTDCNERVIPGLFRYIRDMIKAKTVKWNIRKIRIERAEAERFVDMLILDMRRSAEIYAKFHKKVRYLNEEIGGVIIRHKSKKARSLILENIEPERRRQYRYGRKEFITEMLHWKKQDYKYCGEWHTHPHRLPDLTKQDHRAMKFKAIIFGKIYLIIMHNEKHRVYYGVYQYNRFGLITKKQALYYKSVTYKQQINATKKRN
jgi:proteasome lid subunit RPN8/RPN11